MKTAYVIEDELILRELFAEYFKNALTDLELLGISSEGEEGLQKCVQLKPDLVIADICLPEVNGLEILHILKMRLPDVRVLIFSGSLNEETLRIGVHGKADGFVAKSDSMEQIKVALEDIVQGKKYYSPSVVREMKRAGML